MIEVLKDYKHINDEIKHIEEEIEKLKYRAISPRQSIISDMPKGSPVETDKMAALMVKFEEMEEKYKGLLDDLISKQHEVETAIESLEPIERDLIRYRYIDGLPWFKIQEKLNYGQRNVFRIHERALNKLENVAQQGI